MGFEDSIRSTAGVNVDLIKPVDGVRRQPKYKRRREQKKDEPEQNDEVMLSDEALEALSGYAQSGDKSNRPQAELDSDEHEHINITI